MQRFGAKKHLTSSFSESELVAACAEKNPSAQRVIYERYFAKMVALCARYVGGETAKDLVQDGFIVLFDKIHTYAGTGSFEGWMRRIFVNTALSYLRKNDALRFSSEVQSTLAQSTVSGQILENMEAAQIMQLIEQMPCGFRTVFNLYAIEGYPHNEIAQMLHISESTSRSQFSRARIWLQQKINEL